MDKAELALYFLGQALDVYNTTTHPGSGPQMRATEFNIGSTLNQMGLAYKVGVGQMRQ